MKLRTGLLFSSTFLIFAAPAAAQAPADAPSESTDVSSRQLSDGSMPNPNTGALPPPPTPKRARREVSPPPSEASVVLERRSMPAMVGGIVLTSIGGAGFAFIGATALGDCMDDCGNRDKVVRATVIGAAISLAVGIPLLIYGAKRVPASATATAVLPRWAGHPTADGWSWAL